MEQAGNGAPNSELTRQVDALFEKLGDETQDALDAARDELLRVAKNNPSAVISGVERALARLPVGHPALPELPWILFDIGQDDEITVDAAKLLLGSRDTGVVSVTMDMLVETGNASFAKLLEPLQNDDRWVELRGAKKKFTVGAYARGALDRLLLGKRRP
jgi:hypothetical protein